MDEESDTDDKRRTVTAQRPKRKEKNVFSYMESIG